MHKEKTISMTILFIFLISFLSINTLVAEAKPPCTVSGYVYINGAIQVPEQIILSFQSHKIDATLYNDGFYIVDFDGEIGEIGTFIVTENGVNYSANETIEIFHSVFIYEINLTVNTTSDENISPEVEIVKPEPSTLYFRERKIKFDFFQNTWIFGNITIEINATDIDDGIDRVDLKIQGPLIEESLTFDEGPYHYNWDSFCFGRYNITVTAYDTLGKSSQDSITVFKFF